MSGEEFLNRMADGLKLTCPGCSEEFTVTVPEGTTESDLLPAPCAHCGRILTNDDVKAQALKYSRKVMKDMLRKAGFK